MGLFVIVFVVIFTLVVYWRFFYFFRDPARIAPKGNNIVSPADGTVIYIKNIKAGEIPIAVKNGNKIKLEEISKTDIGGEFSNGYIIGIFMSLFDVHVNRSPIAGVVENVNYFSGINFTMARMTLNKLLRKKEIFQDNGYLLQNERNTLLIRGDFPVAVVQIADLHVNRIVSFVKKQERIEKGQRIGLIKMGSQVDIILPDIPKARIKVNVGQHIKAGETIIAEF